MMTYTGGKQVLKKLLIMMMFGLALNLSGAWLMRSLNSPLFFDTAGTIFVSAIFGYLPGVILGFVTNVLKSLTNTQEFYYGSVNMLVAITAAWTAKKGWFEKPHKAMMAALVIGVSTGVLASVITWFLNYSASTAAMLQSSAQPPIAVTGSVAAQIISDLPVTVSDKVVTVVFVYIIYKLFERFGSSFVDIGRIREGESRTKSFTKTRGASLRTRMVLILLIGSVLLSGTASVISYMLFRSNIVNEHIRMAEGLTALMSKKIDAERIDEFLEKGFDAPGYAETRNELYSLRDSYPDVEYLYVYRISDDGCHVVFDLDTEDLPAQKPGEVVEFDESFLPYRDTLLTGGEVKPIISNDSFGYLLTYYRPLYNSEGKCRCYLAVDFSMDLLSVYGSVFLVRETAIFLGFLMLILVFGISFIEHNIIRPVNMMAYCASSFAFDNEEARAGNIERIRSMQIDTGDEIENLYKAFLKTTEDSMEYVENLKHARGLVEDMQEQLSELDEIAYRDSLTGVKNKAAYDLCASTFDRIISDGAMEKDSIAIVMVDINYMKKINDTYGHESGNIYLINSVRMISRIFGADNIFRVGGDEFAVIVGAEKVKNCAANVARLEREIDSVRNNGSLADWDRVSAAVGAAYFDPERDKCTSDVFVRADKEMYRKKIAMKAARTD